METQTKLDIVVKEIEEAKGITPKGQDVKVYLANILKYKQPRLQELYDILYKLGDDEKILTLMHFPRHLLKLDLDSYNYTDMITGEKIDPLKEYFSVKIHRSFDKWCADYWKLSHGERTNQIPESPVQLFDAMQFHPKLVYASKSLFDTGNYASAILEAFKAVNILVKAKSGLSQNELNELISDTDINEQEGFKLLFMGATEGIRNPKAHDLIEMKDPYRTLEYLGFASLLMHKISF